MKQGLYGQVNDKRRRAPRQHGVTNGDKKHGPPHLRNGRVEERHDRPALLVPHGTRERAEAVPRSRSGRSARAGSRCCSRRHHALRPMPRPCTERPQTRRGRRAERPSYADTPAAAAASWSTLSARARHNAGPGITRWTKPYARSSTTYSATCAPADERSPASSRATWPTLRCQTRRPTCGP
jgi:hypothetical protein